MDLSGITNSLSEIVGKAQESAGSIAGNKTALIGVVLIAAIVVGASFVALNQPNNNNQPVTSKERIVKLEGRDVVIGTGCNCPVDENLVCGSDGKNYLNECFARCLNAEVQSRSPCAGTTEGTSAVGQGSGETAGTICAVGLEVNEGSICGVTEDGFNRCSEGLQCIDNKCVDVDGVNCDGQIISSAEYAADPSACGKTGSCGEKFTPVCADNEVTFTNACEAQKAGYSLSQLAPGPCQAGSCPAANQRCGLTYVSYNGEKQLTWHDSQGCCAGSKCSNGICVGGQSYCPDGKPTTGSLESCYPTSTTIVTSSGGSCPASQTCPPSIISSCPGDGGEDTGSGGGTNATTNVTTLNSGQCSDTDFTSSGSLNAAVRGTVTGRTLNSITNVTRADACLRNSNTTLNEYYCATNGSISYAANFTVICGSGKQCRDGACIDVVASGKSGSSNASLCTDSDNGINLAVAGTTTGKTSSGINTTRIDVCTNQTQLREYYCNSQHFVNYTLRSCPAGQNCTQGACVTPSTTVKTGRGSSAFVRCEDNDIAYTPTNSGNQPIGNISVTGITELTREDGSTVQRSDLCTDLLHVRQYYCIGVNEGNLVSPCPSGQNCIGGACVVPGTSSAAGLTCSETDLPTSSSNGGNVGVSGVVSMLQGATVVTSFPDKCIDSTQLNQSYCSSGSTAGFRVSICPTGTTCIGEICTSSASQQGSPCSAGQVFVNGACVQPIFPKSINYSGILNRDPFRENLDVTNNLPPLILLYVSAASGSPSIRCPSGSVDRGIYCSLGSKGIFGWAAFDFTVSDNPLANVKKIYINTSAEGLNQCSSGSCTQAVIEVFTTTDLQPFSKVISWTNKKTCTTAYPQRGVICTVTVSATGASIEGVLIGRSNVTGDNDVDPQISGIWALT